jgi:O-6-methylguanine DNA methyltransferase
VDTVIGSKSWTPPATTRERVTPFQRHVWDVLCTIRIGGVIAYSALARRVGAPNAVGAVANACAECPIVFAISGDRVVRTGGAARLSKQEPEFGSLLRSISHRLDRRKVTVILTRANGENRMNNEEGNKAVVGRWFTEFWGKDVNLAVVDEIAAPDMLLRASADPIESRGIPESRLR